MSGCLLTHRCSRTAQDVIRSCLAQEVRSLPLNTNVTCHADDADLSDLRSANVLPSSATSTPTRTPSRPVQSPPRNTPLSPRPRPPATPDFYTPPRQSIDLPTNVPTPQSPLRTTNGNEDVEFTRPNFRAERPISVPYAGGAKALDDRGMLARGASPRSKVGDKFGGGDDKCQGCSKRVYAAEQVSRRLLLTAYGVAD